MVCLSLRYNYLKLYGKLVCKVLVSESVIADLLLRSF